MSAVTTLLHPALEGGRGGVPLARARLTDQQRLAVLLQGAALLSHLEHGKLFLLRGWDTACVRGDVRLTVDAVAPGRGAELAKVQLLELLGRLFPSSAGRGEAKGAARRLRERWRQPLAPLSPDQAVAEIVDEASFLWEPAFAPARAALLAEHRGERGCHLWVAGPGWNRNRILARETDRARLEVLLTGGEARDLWEGFEARESPSELARKGRLRQAVSGWRRRPPRGRAETLRYARCLYELGLFSGAEEVLKKLGGFEARLLRLRCLGELSKIRGARQMLFRLAKEELSGAQTVALAETAVRILAHEGSYELSREWVERALRAADRPGLRLRGELVAAEAAWDEGEFETMARRLEAALPARDDPELARRWHEVRSLLGIGRHDGPAVVEHSAEVLRHRRRMTRTEAGRRWNDLGYGRLLSGDLAGAERAVRHAQRLLSPTESSSRQTLGVANLAGIRLRRGYTEGVVEALEASTQLNRQCHNVRGLVGDLELWVRLDLVEGRPEAALSRVKEALDLVHESGVSDRQTFDLLAARAYGWMGRVDRAAACLARVSPEILFELEPEERPAVWALAGHADRAASEAADTPWAELWSAHAAGLHPRPGVWDELRLPEAFRRARLIYDYSLLRPEAVPAASMRKAIETLRSVGATGFAERLENVPSPPGGPWSGFSTTASAVKRGWRSCFARRVIPRCGCLTSRPARRAC